MSNRELWPLALETLRALNGLYYPAMEKAARDAGLGDTEWYHLLATLTVDPEPISCEVLRRRNPYTSPKKFAEQLAGLAWAGALLPAEQTAELIPCAYRLSEAGRSAIQWIIKSAYMAMSGALPIPEQELTQLEQLLARLVNTSLQAPEPPGKWSLHLSRKTDPGELEPTLVIVDQYLSDLSAYRDDARLAAWQPHTISGLGWELVSQMWRGDCDSLYEISRKIDRRGYELEEIREALQDLVDRGWVSDDPPGNYVMTVAGQQIRQETEVIADRYFYAPWAILTDDECDQLKVLLLKVWEGLREETLP